MELILNRVTNIQAVVPEMKILYYIHTEYYIHKAFGSKSQFEFETELKV